VKAPPTREDVHGVICQSKRPFAIQSKRPFVPLGRGKPALKVIRFSYGLYVASWQNRGDMSFMRRSLRVDV
jgi:hypothetical protein